MVLGLKINYVAIFNFMGDIVWCEVGNSFSLRVSYQALAFSIN